MSMWRTITATFLNLWERMMSMKLVRLSEYSKRLASRATMRRSSAKREFIREIELILRDSRTSTMRNRLLWAGESRSLKISGE